jgi:MoaA/NifB/PqqE/SkfB family radical SAM enzyme
MREFDGSELPGVGFSIDGSGPEVHDAIRGNRAFERMIPNIERARDLGYHTFGIVSVSRTNAADIHNTLMLCDHLGLSYVNVHHVSNRGFASEQTVLAIDEWRAVCDEIIRCSAGLSLDVRLERTFVGSGQHQASCAVRDQSNLMFLPDGRVFMCPMFIDVPDAHSFVWTTAGLMERQGHDTEQSLSAPVVATHCPAMPFVNEGLCAGAREHGMQISCVLEKTRLRRGSVVADNSRDLP